MFESVAVFFKRGEVVIDDGVDDGVGEVVGASIAESNPAGANAFAHFFEAVPFVFLKGDDEAFAEEYGNLFGHEAIGIFMRHADDGEEEIFVFVDLGALAEVDDIFQRERMEVEALGDLFHAMVITEPDDVEPEDGISAAEFVVELINGSDRKFLDVIAVVCDYLNAAGSADVRVSGIVFR